MTVARGRGGSSQRSYDRWGGGGGGGGEEEGPGRGGEENGSPVGVGGPVGPATLGPSGPPL